MKEQMTGQVFAKVILCGEHAVLRGGLSLVAPLRSSQLLYEVKESKAFKLKYSKKTEAYEILIEGTFEKALSILKKNREDLKFEVQLESLVPLGKGLGGSAAVCVFVSRLMVRAGFMDPSRVFSLSVELENMFHGESSGVDVAGCLSDNLQAYIRSEAPVAVNFEKSKNKFVFGLSDSGESGDTEDCIESILKLKIENKEKFLMLDHKMDGASRLMKEAFECGDLEKLKEAFFISNEVFKDWGLVTTKMDETMRELSNRGAFGVKPSGSGKGGYILSVWEAKDLNKAESACERILEF